VITINMDKAKQIHLSRMRSARDVVFKQLDADRAIATDSGDQTVLASIKARATELRDITKHPDLLAAKNPDELKAVWPACLGSNGG
jgi:hypothetical protein